MGCDIHSIVEVKRNDKWETITDRLFPWKFPFNGRTHGPQPFDWRSYGMFGFLADVRNYSKVPPISEPRGLPADKEYCVVDDVREPWLGDHSFSWLGLDELLAFNYDAYFEDRRTTAQVAPNVFSGAADAGIGNGGINDISEISRPRFLPRPGDHEKT